MSILLRAGRSVEELLTEALEAYKDCVVSALKNGDPEEEEQYNNLLSDLNTLLEAKTPVVGHPMYGATYGLQIGSAVEASLSVFAVNAFSYDMDSKEGMLETFVKDLNRTATEPYTEEQIMEALEEVFTNNNEYELLGIPDPNVGDDEEEEE